jgi:hypothetical protein
VRRSRPRLHEDVGPDRPRWIQLVIKTYKISEEKVSWVDSEHGARCL